jgi:hypothetical protein
LRFRFITLLLRYENLMGSLISKLLSSYFTNLHTTQHANRERTLWKVDGQEIYIVKDTNQSWSQIDNGRKTFTYTFLRWDNGVLFLYRQNDQKSIKIESKSFKEGDNQESIETHIYAGCWVDHSEHEIYGALWKASDAEVYIKRQSASSWIEYHNGFKCCEYEFIRKENDVVYLKKTGWLMYVKLDSRSFVFGQSIDNLDSHVYYGNWADNRAFENGFSEIQTYGELWKVEGREKYFKKHTADMWVEYEDGREIARFVYIQDKGDAIYLQKVGWQMFIRINSSSIVTGESILTLDKKLYAGSWRNPCGFNIDLDEASRHGDYWKVHDRNICFEKISELRWAEYENDVKIHDFYWLRSEGAAVYLKKIGHQLFARIDASTFEWGNNPCEIKNLCHEGTWQKKEALAIEVIDDEDEST